MIIRNQQLNTTQLKDLDKLTQLCLATDKGLPTIYYDLLRQKRTTDCNVLFYQDGNLIGFLSVYFFYDDAFEASLVIAPSHRGQNITSQLFSQVMSLLKKRNMEKIILSSSSLAPTQWLESMGLRYSHSEYHMVRQSDISLLINKSQLSLRIATAQDLKELCKIDSACFTVHQDMVERFMHLLKSDNYKILLAIKNKKTIGKAHIQYKSESAHFSDIAILPPFQKKGLGSELLAHCINEALSQGKTTIDLDVEASNQRALKLYEKHGFKIEKQQDYWTSKVEDFHALLPTVSY